MAKNVYIIIKEIVHHLEPKYDSTAHAHTVAWWMLERLTQQSKLQLITQITVPLEKQQIAQLNKWISDHLTDDYPIHYLLGSVPFGPLEIKVEAPTLIPRPETEEWLANLITTMEPVANEPFTILDMCTGSGCIALWLAQAFPNATVYAVDISDSALALAQKNATHNNISNIRFLKSDLFSMLPQDTRFDVIVSNPPYIAAEEWNDLSATIRKWEDPGALIAANKGLEILAQLAAKAPSYLNQTGPLRTHGFPKLVVEIGYNQGPAVHQLLVDAGFGNVKILYDSNSIHRVVSGW